MKKLRFIIPFVLIILLTSCIEQREADIGIFTDCLNSKGCLCIDTDSYKITSENGRYRYSYMPDSNTLLCVYTDNNGIVVQCSLTVLKADENFRKMCICLSDAFMYESSEKAVGKAFRNGSADIDGYRLALIDSSVGQTFLINHSDDEINTNENPTLKKHIDEKDVSRPILKSDNAE